MVPLVMRSHFSLGWGVGDPDRLCRVARERGFARMALTDIDGLYGLWEFLPACEREGLTPLIGAEVTEPRDYRASLSPPPHPPSPRRCVCLVENEAGYRNLCRLITQRHCTASQACGLSEALRDAGPFDLVQAVAAHHEGLVVLSFLPELLQELHGAGVEALAAVPRRPSTGFEALRRTARRLNVPLVAVPGSFFPDPEDHEFHRVLRAIALNSTLSRLGPADAAPAEAWLADAAEYRRRFEI